MANYFISYALKYKDVQMSPITNYGNLVIDLPHTINDDTDIRDIQLLLADKFPQTDVIVLWFKKLPE